MKLHILIYGASGGVLITALKLIEYRFLVIQAQAEAMKKYKELYENPFFNVAFTFLEHFPIGLIMTLVSAAILRKKPRSQRADTQMVAAP
jgi:hypothetical protein